MEALGMLGPLRDTALLLGLSTVRVAVAFLLVPLFSSDLISATVRNAMFLAIALLSLLLQPSAAPLALTTWPAGEQPKIHVSSPRTAVRQIVRNGQSYWQPPLPNQHSDFIDPFAFIDLVRGARIMGLRPFDIMLEAKAKDLALLRLREQITTFAPDLAGYIC